MSTRSLVMIAVLVSAPGCAQRQRPPKPAPTHADVSYGDHEQQVFDLWLAESDDPTPLVMFIHGGGFRGGSKDQVGGGIISRYLAAGISVAAIEYRFVQHAKLPAAHEDCVRAVQTLRSHADDYNLDTSRFAGFGGSAGAQLVMYLAFHDDFADPDSDDPIARESTRLVAVATNGGQTTMDFDWWLANIPGYDKPHRDLTEYVDTTDADALAALVADISAVEIVTDDDPPIWMSYGMSPDAEIPTEPGKSQGWQVHHVAHGLLLQAKMNELELENDLHYPGAETKYGTREAFLIEKLTD